MVAGEADFPTDLQDPDDSRPAKRVRLEGALGVTEDTRDEMVDDDDWDDIYADAAGAEEAKPTATATEEQIGSAVEVQHQTSSVTDIAAEPDGGVALPDDEPSGDGELHIAPDQEAARPAAEEAAQRAKDVDGLPADAVMADAGQELIDDSGAMIQSTDEPSTSMAGEIPEVEQADQPANSDVNGAVKVSEALERPMSTDKLALLTEHGQEAAPQANGVPSEVAPENGVATIERNLNLNTGTQDKVSNLEPEWEPDSDPEHSDSDSTSDDSSDSDSDSESEGGYELLDAATQAKILMAGDGEDDGGDRPGKSGADHQPRTANEVKEERIPKPDIQITEETKITFLGTVERAVESMVLIKANISGEYQVLEFGSVLCNEKREVIGVVAETLGRVQEPMYSIAFNNSQEVEQYGLEHDSKIYYVDAHSTFVFTQPLKNIKGTDASNIHDEEVGEDELEFSDDEKEAEYKRQSKFSKKAGRGKLGRGEFMRGDYEAAGPRSYDIGPRSFGAPGHDSGNTYVGDRPYTNGTDGTQQSYGGGMNYDDEEGGGEEFYQPLKRPDNLGAMMSGPPRPPQNSDFDRGRGRGGFDRGRGDRGRGEFRGRGDRGRGRGDRGRGRGGFDRGGRGGFDRGGRGGRGGFDKDQRGGRGGFDKDQRGSRGGPTQSNGFRGNAQSYPDSHNNDPPRQNGQDGYGRQSHNLPPRPPASQTSPPPPPPPQQQYQQPIAPNTYQFNGYTFQYGQTPLQQAAQAAYSYQQPAQTPPAPQAGHGYQQALQGPPSGAYVNPAFYHNQQQQQAYAGYGAQPPAQQAGQHQQYGQATAGAPGGGGQQPADLADILRRLGGQGQ